VATTRIVLMDSFRDCRIDIDPSTPPAGPTPAGLTWRTTMALTPIILRLPPEWIEEIDKRRGPTPRAEFLRDIIRPKLGRQKLPTPRRRGRPVSEPPPPAT